MIPSIIIQLDHQIHDYKRFSFEIFQHSQKSDSESLSTESVSTRKVDLYSPFELLTGTFHPVDVGSEQIDSFEFSVLWFTEGKGDEDLGVHFFKSLQWSEEVEEQKMKIPQGSASNCVFPLPVQDSGIPSFRFSVRLPASPLSYYGKILKIYWCVRVRLFLKSGIEVKNEHIFNLGRVSPVHVELN